MRAPKDQGLFFTVFFSISLALILFVIIAVLTYINNRVQGSRVFYG